MLTISNFTLLNLSLSEVATLVAAMLRARAAVEERSWLHPQEPTTEEWRADVLADPRARTPRRRSDYTGRQAFYRLADELRDTILVACSKCDWKAAFRRDGGRSASALAPSPLPPIFSASLAAPLAHRSVDCAWPRALSSTSPGSRPFRTCWRATRLQPSGGLAAGSRYDRGHASKTPGESPDRGKAARSLL